MDELSMAFAENLRKHRKRLNMTQEKLAEKLGYSEKAVSKWESGATLPPVAVLVKLGDVLQISLDDLLSYHAEIGYFLGIDGGGTKTDFVLADSNGKVINEVKLSGCNPVDIGLEKALAILEEGIRTVCSEIPFRKISVFAGLAGGISGNYKEKIGEFLSSFRFGRCNNGSDAEAVVAAGLKKGDGIAVIMGTGSIAFVQKNQQSTRLGGLGYLFDNGGNGYSLGRDGIRAALNMEVGGGADTKIRELLLEKLPTETVLPYLTEFYEMGKKGIASYAPLTVQAAQEGDKVALQILYRNMGEIAELISVGGGFFSPEEIPVRVVLFGGLTAHSKILLPMIIAQLEQPEKYCFEIYRDSVAYGDLLLAGMAEHE